MELLGWIGFGLVALYVLSGAVVMLYESTQTGDPLRVMTIIDWIPRFFGR